MQAPPARAPPEGPAAAARCCQAGEAKPAERVADNTCPGAGVRAAAEVLPQHAVRSAPRFARPRPRARHCATPSQRRCADWRVHRSCPLVHLSTSVNQTRSAASRAASRVNLASVQTRRSTHHHGSRRAEVSPAGEGVATTVADFVVLFSSFRFIGHPLSCVPSDSNPRRDDRGPPGCQRIDARPDRLRHSLAGSPIHADRIEFTATARTGRLRFGRVVLVPLLSTPCCHAAVPVRYRTILHRTGADLHRSVFPPSQAHEYSDS